MIAAIALGTRLALRTSHEGRIRAGLVGLAAAVGTLVILSVLAIAAADRQLHPERYGDDGMTRLVALVMMLFVVQVAGLAGVAGRLAAALRARRLASLRLLGMSTRRMRLVTAVEVGVAAVAGAVAGVALFPLVRLALAQLRVGGQRWTTDVLGPSPMAWIAVPLGVTAVVVAVAVLPERSQTRAALAQARRAEARPPSLLRLVPLVAGVALSAYLQVARRGDESAARLLFGAIGLLAIGTVLVLPVFVRLAAVALLRGGRQVPTLVAARRLQAQPAGVTRVITGLLLALFVVVGARGVVAAWEATPQYVVAARQLDEQQNFSVGLAAGDRIDIEGAIRRIEAFPGVRRVGVYYDLVELCADDAEVLWCGGAIVADCATWALLRADVRECVDGELSWLLGPGGSGPRTLAAQLPDGTLSEATITVPPPEHAIGYDARIVENRGVGGDVLIPPSYPGVAELIAAANPRIHVAGDPGHDLGQRLLDAGLIDWTEQEWLLEDYYFVAMLRTIVYSVAAVLVGIGVLGFAISAIDRVIARRRELVSLRLVGVPSAALRRAQWIEALIPVTGGALLAIVLGQLIGVTYLAFGDDPDLPTMIPWKPTLVLAAFVAVVGVIVAGLTVIASTQPITADTIRTE